MASSMAVLSPFLSGRAIPISISSRAHHRRLVSEFSGQRLRLTKNVMKISANTHLFVVQAHMNKQDGSINPSLLESGEDLLDDLSQWISKKVAEKAGPYLPENFDPLNWLPDSLHKRIHSAERMAAIFVRECLVLVVFSFIFARVGKICLWLSRVHHLRAHKGKETPEFNYKETAYSALEDPLKTGLLLWQLTRMLHFLGPFIKLRLDIAMLEKLRSIGFIICLTWFLLKWKRLALERSISQNKRDAPQLIALDKVLSLLLYYIAGTCIGEVSGLAFRSVLAIGGVSGIAVGLAAKEIVGNLLAGALLFIVRPFVIGDRVKAKSFEGWVEDIDFLHTKVIGYDRSPVLVPNSAIMNEVIINHSRAKCRQLVAGFQLEIGDIFLVNKLTDEIAHFLANHEMVDLENGARPLCYLKNMSPEGLELELLCSIKEKGFDAFFRAKQEILVEVAKIVTSAGAHFEKLSPVVLVTKDAAVVNA